MTEKYQNFEMYQGETCRPTFSVVDSNGDVLVLTGGVAVWYMLRDEVLVTKAGTIDGSTVTVELVESDTLNIAEGNYDHQLWVTDADSDKVCVAAGKVTLLNKLNT